MKILFSMRHPGALRNFASTVRELAKRGHRIHLAFVMQDKLGDGRLLWDLTDDYATITHTELARKKTPYRFWLGLARGVRFWVPSIGMPTSCESGPSCGCRGRSSASANCRS